MLRAPEQHSRELRVAAIEALGLFPRVLAAPGAWLLREQIARLLGEHYMRDAGAGERLVQAHVPPALARILLPGDPVVSLWRDRFAADLQFGLSAREARDEAARGSNLHIAQSCALALGDLCEPWDGDDAIPGLLLDASHRHRDQQTRSFALLALGVHAARHRPRDAARIAAAAHDEELAAALRTALEAARNPSALGALALALGLSGDPNAVPQLQRTLAAYHYRDDVAG